METKNQTIASAEGQPDNMEQPGRTEFLAYQQQMYRIVIPIFLIVACLGVLANLLVIVALKPIGIRNSNITLIMSLTLTDIWTISVVAFSLLYNSYLPIVKGTDVDACFSLTLEILRTGGLLTGILHLLLISIHHYIVILYPHVDHLRLKGMISTICVAAWVAPLFVLLLLAMVFPDQGYWNCEHVFFYHSSIFRFSVSGLLLAMFIVITGCYIRLYVILRSNRAKLSQNRLAMTDKKRAQEKRILWTMVLICSSFFIGWAPATIVFAVTCETCELLKQQQFRTLFALSSFQLSFILGKSLANPLIYSIRIPEVDAQIRRFYRSLPFPRLVDRGTRTESLATAGAGLDGVISMARVTRREETPLQNLPPPECVHSAGDIAETTSLNGPTPR